MTPAAEELLAGLAERTGRSEGDVLRLALGLFKTAVDAKEQGKHVGVASTPAPRASISRSSDSEARRMAEQTGQGSDSWFLRGSRVAGSIV
jgi:hypothetical protein